MSVLFQSADIACQYCLLVLKEDVSTVWECRHSMSVLLVGTNRRCQYCLKVQTSWRHTRWVLLYVVCMGTFFNHSSFDNGNHTIKVGCMNMTTQPDLALAIGTNSWNWQLKLKIETENWNWHLALKFGTYNRHWQLALAIRAILRNQTGKSVPHD